MNEMYCTQCGHDPLLQADNDKRNKIAIEKLQTAIEIERAQLAALRSERDILSDELNSERECSTALGAYLDQAHKDVEQISDELSASRARIAELEAARAAVCKWYPDENGYWDGACGVAWALEDGTPRENDMNFCPKCGKKLIEQPAAPEVEG